MMAVRVLMCVRAHLTAEVADMIPAWTVMRPMWSSP